MKESRGRGGGGEQREGRGYRRAEGVGGGGKRYGRGWMIVERSWVWSREEEGEGPEGWREGEERKERDGEEVERVGAKRGGGRGNVNVNFQHFYFFPTRTPVSPDWTYTSDEVLFKSFKVWLIH